MTQKLPAVEKRSRFVLVSLKWLEYDALKKRAAENGSTMSSTLRVALLKDLAIGALETLKQRVKAQAPRQTRTEPIEADADWPEASGR
jgi:hypothetical protein